uniref:transposase n=1 Tax=Candidatus Thiosymbion oneisti TaxID=589554 RepID=UPI001A9C4A4C
RVGTAVNFMLTEPLGGRRKVSVRSTKTALDLAEEIKTLRDVDYANAERVVLVWDNLNTHTPASLYKAFPPEQARRLLDRLEIHYTPKHGSWLDIAEIELSVFSEQCLNASRIWKRSAARLPPGPSGEIRNKPALTGSSPPTRHASSSSDSTRNIKRNEKPERVSQQRL